MHTLRPCYFSSCCLLLLRIKQTAAGGHLLWLSTGGEFLFLGIGSKSFVVKFSCFALRVSLSSHFDPGRGAARIRRMAVHVCRRWLRQSFSAGGPLRVQRLALLGSVISLPRKFPSPPVLALCAQTYRTPLSKPDTGHRLQRLVVFHATVLLSRGCGWTHT